MLNGKWYLMLSLLVVLVGSGCIPIQQPGGSISSTLGPTLQPVAHVGGVAVSIAVRGNYAYLGLSHELVVLDVTDRTQPRQIAALPTPATDIELTERYAYVVGRDGLHIIDIAEPTTPRVLGHWQAERTLADVVVVGDFAYIVSYSDLYVLAVDEPHKPRLVSHSQLDDLFVGIAAAHDYMYAIGARGFYTFDVADPTRPRKVEFVETEVSPNGSISLPDSAYFGGENLLQRVDLALPETPARATALPVQGWVADVVVENGLAYLATGYGGLQVWDIRNERAPARLGAYDTEGLATTLAVDGGYVYLIDCDEGLQIFDVMEPARVQKVGSFATLGVAYKVAANDSFAYVAGGFNGGLHIVDIEQAAVESSLSVLPQTIDVKAVALANEYLYMIDGGALKIYDATNRTIPHQIGAYELDGENALKVDAHLAYLSNNQGDVLVLNVSEPTQIKVVASYKKLGYVNAMAIDNDLVYIPHRDYGVRILTGGEDGMRKQIGRYDVKRTATKIAVKGNYAYIALGAKGIHIVDVSDPTQPHVVNSDSTVGNAQDIVIRGWYAFVAADDAGVQVLDIANPRAPTAVALYATLDCATSMALTDNYLYVVDRFGGILIYAMNDALQTLHADYAFIDVNVITMTDEEILPHQTVLVANGRITEIGPSVEIDVPANAVRIPAPDHYLMPGLADMHIHLRDESYLALLLANGVTTVRNMDGRPEHLLWRAQIANGERRGPRIFTAGPIVDELPAHLPTDHLMETPEGAAQIVAEQQAQGYDFIKVYDGLTLGAYANIMTAAQAAHMPVVGHIPNSLSGMDAILAGQRSIEHLEGYFGVYADQLPTLLQATVEHDVWNCPTLTMLQRMTPTADGAFTIAQQAMLDYMPTTTLETWWMPSNFADVGYTYRSVKAANLAMVHDLYQAGAPLLLGTDAPMPCAVPGFAVHQELQNLVDAGLSPYAALQTATTNPARFLNRLNDVGTVTEGKQADLLLLAANPLVDIANTTQIAGVMMQGQWLSAAVLQQMLNENRNK